jgi:hypothetical protein
VEDERRQVDLESGRARLALGREVRECEGPHEERGRQERDQLLETVRGRLEAAREAIEQIREEHEQRDECPQRKILRGAARVLGQEAPRVHDDGEDGERHGGPHRRAALALPPEPQRGQREGAEERKVDVPDRFDDRAQASPRSFEALSVGGVRRAPPPASRQVPHGFGPGRNSSCRPVSCPCSSPPSRSAPARAGSDGPSRRRPGSLPPP